MLLPLRISISLSATNIVVLSTVVVVPLTVRLPPIVTVEPSSVIILFANCVLALSHFGTLLPVKFALFLIENTVPERTNPPVADAV